MTEEDFIRNNGCINGGSGLPREYLFELYQAICQNETCTTPQQCSVFPNMTRSHWICLMHESRSSSPFVSCDSGVCLDYNTFSIISGPTIAALSVIFDHADGEDILETCIEGFLSIVKISAHYHLEQVVDDVVVSLCKFTTLLHPFSVRKFLLSFGDDTKARMSTVAVFNIANRYGDFIRSGWKIILDCILTFHKLEYLPPRLASDAADDSKPSSDKDEGGPATSFTPPSGLIARLYLDPDDPMLQPSEERLAAHKSIIRVIESCHIDNIFTESKFLQAESLVHLSRAIVSAAVRNLKWTSPIRVEENSVFCLELLIGITLINRDRFTLLWQVVYDHIANVLQLTIMPCSLAEKAVLGLLRICQRLIPYNETLTDELLKSLQLILKLDACVADAYCELIIQEVMNLVKGSVMQIRSHVGWHTIISLLSITVRHPEASELGFETLSFVMADGAYLLPSNYVLCVNAALKFSESRVGHVERSLKSLDLMAGSVICLVKWSSKTKEASIEESVLGDMLTSLVLGLRKVCLDPREEVRNHAVLSLQRCLSGVSEVLLLPDESWVQCFDLAILKLLDDLIYIISHEEDYGNMEVSLTLSVTLLSEAFLQFLPCLSKSASFFKLWFCVLHCMERSMKVKFRRKPIGRIRAVVLKFVSFVERSMKVKLVVKPRDGIREVVLKVLKHTLFVMKTNRILVPGGEDISFWQLTWLHVNNIAPSLQGEVFPPGGAKKSSQKHQVRPQLENRFQKHTFI